MPLVLLCLMTRQKAMRWECGVRVCWIPALSVPLWVREQSCGHTATAAFSLAPSPWLWLSPAGLLVFTERRSLLPLCTLRLKGFLSQIAERYGSFWAAARGMAVVPLNLVLAVKSGLSPSSSPLAKQWSLSHQKATMVVTSLPQPIYLLKTTSRRATWVAQ